MYKPIRRSSQLARVFALIGSTAIVVGGCAPHQPPSTAIVSQKTEPASLCQLVPPPQRVADSLWIVATDRPTPSYAPKAYTLAERVVFPLLYSTPIAPHCDSVVAGQVIRTDFVPLGEMLDRDAANSRAFVVDPLKLGQTWAPRTGRYEIATASDSGLALLPREPATGPHVRFSAIDDPQGRDAIDAGADVILTSDPGTTAYAAAQSDLISVPLMWDRVYVLVEPARRNHGDRDSVLALQRDLATNVLRVEARPATYGGMELLACPTIGPGVAHAFNTPTIVDSVSPAPTAPTAPGRTPRLRIVYENDDSVARAISERLVALAQGRSQRLAALESVLSSAGAARAVGLDSAAFRQALQEGNEAAYVVSVPFYIGCPAVDGLEMVAPWLRSTGSEPMDDHITSLVETRARALVRRERVGLALDGTGNVHLLFGSRPPS